MQRGRAAGPLAKGVLYYNTHLANLPKRAKGHLDAGVVQSRQPGTPTSFAGSSELQSVARLRADTRIGSRDDAGLDPVKGTL